MARDHFGVKPLFYTIKDDCFIQIHRQHLVVCQQVIDAFMCLVGEAVYPSRKQQMLLDCQFSCLLTQLLHVHSQCFCHNSSTSFLPRPAYRFTARIQNFLSFSCSLSLVSSVLGCAVVSCPAKCSAPCSTGLTFFPAAQAFLLLPKQSLWHGQYPHPTGQSGY